MFCSDHQVPAAILIGPGQLCQPCQPCLHVQQEVGHLSSNPQPPTWLHSGPNGDLGGTKALIIVLRWWRAPPGASKDRGWHSEQPSLAMRQKSAAEEKIARTAAEMRQKFLCFAAFFHQTQVESMVYVCSSIGGLLLTFFGGYSLLLDSKCSWYPHCGCFLSR